MKWHRKGPAEPPSHMYQSPDFDCRTSSSAVALNVLCALAYVSLWRLTCTHVVGDNALLRYGVELDGPPYLRFIHPSQGESLHGLQACAVHGLCRHPRRVQRQKKQCKRQIEFRHECPSDFQLMAAFCVAVIAAALFRSDAACTTRRRAPCSWSDLP